MKSTGAIVSIELHGKEAEDGRTLVRSPDLEGFYFVVPSGEDPVTTMKPTLMEFVRIYLKAEVRKIERTQTPRQFRHWVHVRFVLDGARACDAACGGPYSIKIQIPPGKAYPRGAVLPSLG